MYVLPSDLTFIETTMTTEVMQKWIDKAEARLSAIAGSRGYDLEVIFVDSKRQALVKDVLENAIVRVIRNPEGFQSESEDGYSVAFNPRDAAGNIWFPADDLDLLFPPKSGYGSYMIGAPRFVTDYMLPRGDQIA